VLFLAIRGSDKTLKDVYLPSGSTKW